MKSAIRRPSLYLIKAKDGAGYGQLSPVSLSGRETNVYLFYSALAYF